MTEVCEKNHVFFYARKGHGDFHVVGGWGLLGMLGGTRSREEVDVNTVDFLGFMMGGVHVKNVAPLVKLASSCEHISGERHRFALFDLAQLVRDLGGDTHGGFAVVPLGGLRMGRFGIVLMGHAATDMWAVLRNVIWEDEHCTVCCGALLRYNEVFDHKVLLRCGPTIGVEWATLTTEQARRITDEYWAD